MKAQIESIAQQLVGRRLSGAAPAKLNLALRIVGRRPDGFHLLEMYNVLLGFGDTVMITVREPEVRRVRSVVDELAGDLTLPASFDAVETNLAGLAASRLFEALELPLGFDIEITKRIPLGAGLGGGSSDAATVIKLLLGLVRDLWGGDIPPVDGLAVGLGADVPFFLGGRSAFARGIGDVLSPVTQGGVPAGTRCLVLVPSVAVPTPAAYALYRQRFPGDLPQDSRAPLRSLVVADDRRSLVVNDLERVVLDAYPEVGGTLERVRGVRGVVAGMTGSGSAIFCLPEVGATFARGVEDGVRAAAGSRVIVTVVA